MAATAEHQPRFFKLLPFVTAPNGASLCVCLCVYVRVCHRRNTGAQSQEQPQEQSQEQSQDRRSWFRLREYHTVTPRRRMETHTFKKQPHSHRSTQQQHNSRAAPKRVSVVTATFVLVCVWAVLSGAPQEIQPRPHVHVQRKNQTSDLYLKLIPGTSYQVQGIISSLVHHVYHTCYITLPR